MTPKQQDKVEEIEELNGKVTVHEKPKDLIIAEYLSIWGYGILALIDKDGKVVERERW